MFHNMHKTRALTGLVNKRIRRIHEATEVYDVRSIKNFNTILRDNPDCEKIQGYYVKIPLSAYQTFVPNSPHFPDRFGQNYTSGQFDAPLFRLKEWRENWDKGHPGSTKPDLLVNANWFNVWKSGVYDQGEKFNPREQARTYLAGLSISEGKLVSSHKVLDQHNAGLDTIIFDMQANQARVIPHHEIDNEIANNTNFFKNKNAVSGFIILKDKNKMKTPDLNNHHNNRLPRTGIGYKNDGKNIIVMVIDTARNCGVTADDFANLFEALGCTNAINLDNSGSAELYYQGLSEFGKKTTTVNSAPSDVEGSHRPKPNCLGFKNKYKCAFFASDDTDAALDKSVNAANVLPEQPKTDDNFTYKYYIKR